MSMPKRIKLSRKRGWKMPKNTVRVCRPGKWGNPYVVQFDPHVDYNPQTVAESVQKFRTMAENSALFRRDLHELTGKNLGCWCKVYVCDKCGAECDDIQVDQARCKEYYAQGPANERRRCHGTLRRQLCHADVLLELANP